jgi:hypothetical protein
MLPSLYPHRNSSGNDDDDDDDDDDNNNNNNGNNCMVQDISSKIDICSDVQ